MDIYCILSYLKNKKKSTFLFFYQTNLRYLFAVWVPFEMFVLDIRPTTLWLLVGQLLFSH